MRTHILFPIFFAWRCYVFLQVYVICNFCQLPFIVISIYVFPPFSALCTVCLCHVTADTFTHPCSAALMPNCAVLSVQQCGWGGGRRVLGGYKRFVGIKNVHHCRCGHYRAAIMGCYLMVFRRICWPQTDVVAVSSHSTVPLLLPPLTMNERFYCASSAYKAFCNGACNCFLASLHMHVPHAAANPLCTSVL